MEQPWKSWNSLGRNLATRRVADSIVRNGPLGACWAGHESMRRCMNRCARTSSPAVMTSLDCADGQRAPPLSLDAKTVLCGCGRHGRGASRGRSSRSIIGLFGSRGLPSRTRRCQNAAVRPIDAPASIWTTRSADCCGAPTWLAARLLTGAQSDEVTLHTCSL